MDIEQRIAVSFQNLIEQPNQYFEDADCLSDFLDNMTDDFYVERADMSDSYAVVNSEIITLLGARICANGSSGDELIPGLSPTSSSTR